MKMPERRSLLGANWKNWGAEAWEPMSNRRNGLGQGEGTKGKNVSKMSWRPKAVSMVFILKWINCSYYTSKEVISLKIVCIRVEHAVDNQL